MFVNMSKNDQPEQDPWHLHLRKAKGEFLSDEEQNQLADWYRQQEQQERVTLQSTSSNEQVAPLQAQIDSMLVQMANTTAQIQQLTAENRRLRQEIGRLETQLAQQATPQPA